MNRIERQAAAHLQGMRETHELFAVKAEFEAQGMELPELMRLKDIVSSAGLKIMLKIGGVEDVWGIQQALLVGVGGIVFPMAESPFALQKSLDAAKEHISEDEREDIHLAVNVETETACQKIDKIVEVAKVGGLDAITLGRVDLVGSMGLGRDAINSDRVFKIANNTCDRVKQAGLQMTLGGGVEVESYEFIWNLETQGLIDRFETRMAIFPSRVAAKKGSYEAAVKAAHKFEIYWLECMGAKYERMAAQRRKRILMLKRRIGEE
jgi:4-hydroxy-2-oxoheptanedioate aldolase